MVINVVEYVDVRSDYYVEKKSVRRIARETGRSRKTIKKYLGLDEPPPHYQQSLEREAPVLGPFKNIIEEMILVDLEKKPRERRTAHVLYQELVSEHKFPGAEPTVRKFFCVKRRELSGQYRAFAPLEHPPCGEAQMDWVEDVPVTLGGNESLLQVFVLRFSHSRRVFVRAFHRMHMPAFLEGHVAGFSHFEAVPPLIWYDNLKCAVLKVLKGRQRVENEQFKKLRGYYRFDARFCMVRTPEEKGGVENLAGYVRRNFFVPKISAENLDELNERLLQKCLAEDGRVTQGASETIGEAFLREKGSLLELPMYHHDCADVVPVRADKYSRVHFETNRYSVPVAYALMSLTLRAYANHLVIARGEKVVAEWKRSYEENDEKLEPLHYVPLLKRKPGLLYHGKPFAGWNLPAVFERFRQRFRFLYRDKGDRQYIKILLHIEKFSVEEMAAALLRAEELGLSDPEGIGALLSLRGSEPGVSVESGTSLEGLCFSSIRVLQPSLQQYDELLECEEVTV